MGGQLNSSCWRIGGGAVGSAGGPVGAFALGVTGATFGDYIKDEIKFNLKKDVDK